MTIYHELLNRAMDRTLHYNVAEIYQFLSKLRKDNYPGILDQPSTFLNDPVYFRNLYNFIKEKTGGNSMWDTYFNPKFGPDKSFKPINRYIYFR